MVSKSIDIHTNQLQPFEPQHRRLLLEISASTLTVLLWDKQANQPLAVEVFNGLASYPQDWPSVLSQSALLANKQLETLVLLGTAAAMPVPAFLYQPTTAALQLSMLHGHADDIFTGGDVLPTKDMVLAWQLPGEAHGILTGHFSILQIRHVATAIISNHAPLEGANGHIIIYDSLAWVLLWQHGQLLFASSVSAGHTNDLSYHLLNICNQYKLEPAAVTWKISGMVAQGSPLLNAITRFFEHAELDDSTLLDGVAGHYFSHVRASLGI